MKENIKINTLSDTIKNLNDSMSEFKNVIPSLKEYNLNFFDDSSFSTPQKTDKERIQELETKILILDKSINKSYIDIQKQAEYINESINSTIDTEIKKVEPKLDGKIKENIDDKMISERNNIIWSLSLFVAFFTFISINITIFSKVDDVFFALVLMCWMIISIAIMLLIFFLFLHYKPSHNIFRSQLFKILIGLILLLLLFLLIFFFIKTPLSPSLENKVNDINEKNNKIEIKLDNEIKLLKYENNLLKEKLEKQISKEVEFQLLKQQPKNTSN